MTDLERGLLLTSVIVFGGLGGSALALALSGYTAALLVLAAAIVVLVVAAVVEVRRT